MAQAIGPNQEKWLQALESGEYEQCRERLGFIDREGSESNCCLGVAAKVIGLKPRVFKKFDSGAAEMTYGDEDEFTNGYAPVAVVDRLALHSEKGRLIGRELRDCRSLSGANDEGATFAEIAAFCRANPEAVFTEPR